MGIFDRLFNKKPKNLREQIEGFYEEAIKKASKESDVLIQSLIITQQIAVTTETLKGIYSDVHRQLGYNKLEYEKLVDEICSKMISKYFSSDSKYDDFDDMRALAE